MIENGECNRERRISEFCRIIWKKKNNPQLADQIYFHFSKVYFLLPANTLTYVYILKSSIGDDRMSLNSSPSCFFHIISRDDFCHRDLQGHDCRSVKFNTSPVKRTTIMIKTTSKNVSRKSKLIDWNKDKMQYAWFQYHMKTWRAQTWKQENRIFCFMCQT